MELVKNIASGKLFVVLDDTSEPDFLVITPEGKVRRLEKSLFQSQGIADPADALSSHQLTKTQVELYSEYFEE